MGRGRVEAGPVNGEFQGKGRYHRVRDDFSVLSTRALCAILRASLTLPALSDGATPESLELRPSESGCVGGKSSERGTLDRVKRGDSGRQRRREGTRWKGKDRD